MFDTDDTSNLGHKQKAGRHKIKKKGKFLVFFYGKVPFIELTPGVWISS